MVPETSQTHENTVQPFAPVTLGARPSPEGVDYQVWAPTQDRVSVVIVNEGQAERRLALHAEKGWHAATDPQGRVGDRYWFELSDGTRLADPRSRFQPLGVTGPSEVIDPAAFRWQTKGWHRPSGRDLVIYEVHVGTFTEEGTFLAAISRLRHVARLGANAIQLMPLADFPGAYNWGYDGTALFAPSRAYGRPEDLHALVDAAHLHGLAVILDVVYNHTGPEGSVLHSFSPHYFHTANKSDWGTGFNFDGEQSKVVRDFFLSNVAYWFDEYRIDGLRADATHAIHDASAKHILAEIADVAHSRGGFVIAEDERNEVALLQSPDGTGQGFDAVWSDDFHHSVRVALTGMTESYFAAYAGSTEELVQTLAQGWTYCGKPFALWKGKERGTPCTHLHPSRFVYCIENHDQSGNRAFGERLGHMVSDDLYRAASALLCLSPYTPMLFMGQEWRTHAPFLFFSDLSGEIGASIRKGRIEEFRRTGLNADANLDEMPDPQSRETFQQSKPNWGELEQPRHLAIAEFYRECLRWRREHLLKGNNAREHWSVTGKDDLIRINYWPPHGTPWILAVTFEGGTALVAPDLPAGFDASGWALRFHSMEARFGEDQPLTLPPVLRPGERISLDRPVAIVLEACHVA